MMLYKYKVLMSKLRIKFKMVAKGRKTSEIGLTIMGMMLILEILIKLPINENKKNFRMKKIWKNIRI
jgi:hypothetical protein